MKALGKLGAHTLLILTPEESKLIREVLEGSSFAWDKISKEGRAVKAFNAGIQRATERLQGEFDELQQTKKRGSK